MLVAVLGSNSSLILEGGNDLLQSMEFPESNAPVFEYISHSPISIISDSALSAFPGSGTPEDPYVIEGYNITTTSSCSIYISGTTKYFAIRNCYLRAENNGIGIANVAADTAKIINNICESNSLHGIYLYQSHTLIF